MKPKVYIETSIPSYLTARRSRDLIVAANQSLTQDWWDNKRHLFELFISEFVSNEVSAGDPEIAKSRLNAIDGIPELAVNDKAGTLAIMIMKKLVLPDKAKIDAFHIAIATVHAMDYLLTWNFAHIHNAALVAKMTLLCQEQGYTLPTICSPQELFEV